VETSCWASYLIDHRWVTFNYFFKILNRDSNGTRRENGTKWRPVWCYAYVHEQLAKIAFDSAGVESRTRDLLIGNLYSVRESKAPKYNNFRDRYRKYGTVPEKRDGWSPQSHCSSFICGIVTSVNYADHVAKFILRKNKVKCESWRDREKLMPIQFYLQF